MKIRQITSRRIFKFLVLAFFCFGLLSCDSAQNKIKDIQSRIFSKHSEKLSPAHKQPTSIKSHAQKAIKEKSLTKITLSDSARKRLGIKIATVRRQTIKKIREFGGEIMVPPGQTISVSAPLTGIVLAPAGNIIPPVGALINRSETVLRLLMLPPEKDLLTARADLKIAQNRLSLARKRAERAEQLLEIGAGSLRSKETALSELDDSKAVLRLAEALVDLIDKQDYNASAEDFTSMNVGGPIKGILRNMYVATGQRVSAGFTLFEMTSQDLLWIRVPVYAGLLNQLDTEQSVTVHDLTNTSDSQGVVAYPVAAPPSGNPTAASIDLYFKLPYSEGGFQPGQKVVVALKLKSREKGLTVPRSSILYDIHGGTWVYQNTKKNQFIRRRIELQTIVDDVAVLARGPDAGTEIVSVGAAELFGTEFGVGK